MIQQTTGAVRRRSWQCAVLGLGIVAGLVGLLADQVTVHPEAARRRPVRALLQVGDRIVLEDEQAVEQRPPGGQAAARRDRHQRGVLEPPGPHLLVLKPGEPLGHGPVAVEADPYRSGVDQQADHRVHAVDLAAAP